MTFNGWMKQINGNVYEVGAAVYEDCADDIYTVYANGSAYYVLDPEFGMGIDIELDDEIEGYMANYLNGIYWCKPYFGKTLDAVPDETQLLLGKMKSGEYIVILPVTSKQYKCVLKGTEKGLCARLYSRYPKLNFCHGAAFVYAKGKNPFELLDKCYRRALDILDTGVRMRKDRRYPEVFEYLGWCSWDSFQIRVNEEGILQKCEEFAQKEIPVKWLIFDDMWADIKEFNYAKYENFSEMMAWMHRSSLYSFEADPIRFPNGLKGAVSKVKEKGYCVGMWFPTTGYWNGINPNGEAYRQTKDYLTETDNGQIIHDWKFNKAFMFYKTVFDFFKSCGADFVKIDNQSKTNRLYSGLAPVGESSAQYHEAMEAAAGYHFDNAMINCMAMASEDVWNRQISPITRCSDDFMPENKESFANHIMQCAYNSYAQGPMYWCDWDMWWTDDSQGKKHSVMRAVSGGPVYISDKVGRSNKELLTPLMLDDGRILRCDKPGTPTLDCLTDNPLTSGKIFKIQNICGDSGAVAVFNLDKDNHALSGTISPADVDGIEGDTFAVYEHFSGSLNILNKNEKIDITLNDNDEVRLYIIVPIKDGFAPIGLVDKYISPKTIKHVTGKEIITYNHGKCAYVENGKLKFYLK